MKKNFKTFLFSLLLVSIPLLIIIAIYIIKDPFRVIYSYDRIYKNDVPDNPVNRDYASTEILLRNYEKEKYCSFILGSSRSLAFRCTEFDNYINCNCFHYDASAESLNGVFLKIKFIDKLGLKLKNCIIILDSSLINQPYETEDHLLLKHPLVAESSYLKFQFIFLKTFISNKYFIPYLFSLNNIELPPFYGYPFIKDHRLFVYDSISNDISMPSADYEIMNDTNAYYNKLGINFESINEGVLTQYESMINENNIKILEEIKKYFDKHKTNYFIIIYPEFNKRNFNIIDLKILNSIFGKNVYDYSGINKHTNYYTNYYDKNHLRWFSGNEILKEFLK